MNTDSKKILIVDDEEDLRYAIQQILEGKGFAVKTASSGIEALGILQEGYGPDLTITDQDMPQMKGLALIEEIHRSQPNAKCLLMSGSEQMYYKFTDKPNEQKGAGLAGFLTKPVYQKPLLAVVCELLA